MSQYLAGGLMLLLLCAATLLGLEAFGIYDSVRMVDAALLETQVRLAADGGVSSAVQQQVRRSVTQAGGDPARLAISGTRPWQGYGQTVALTVSYERPYALATLVPGGSGWKSGMFRIRRTATTLSGWAP